MYRPSNMGIIIGIILILIFVTGMGPAILSNDPFKVQEAADRTSERLINFGVDRIVDKVEGLPLKVITNNLKK